MERFKVREDKKRKKDKNNKKTNKSTKKNNKKERKGLKTFLRILLVLIVLILGVAAALYYNVIENGGGVKGLVTTVIGSDDNKVNNLEDIYVLCMGKSQNMTDTLMVVKYSPRQQEIEMLSIPRDSYVGLNKDKASAFDKINALYQISPQKTLDAVNRLTNLNIKYYAMVDTKALRSLVDALGGVTFDVPIDMDYDDSSQNLEIHVSKGVQKLNGTQAEGVVRFRHNNDGSSYPNEYGNNDIGRMRTQREFIKTVIKETMKPGNITKVNKLIEIAQKEVQTNLVWEDKKDYIPALMNFNIKNMHTGTLSGTPQYINDLSFFVVNEDRAKANVYNMFLTKTFLEEKEDEEATSEETKEVDKKETEKKEETTKKKDTKKKPKLNDNIMGELEKEKEDLKSGLTYLQIKNKNSKYKVEIINASGSFEKAANAKKQLEAFGFKVVDTNNTNQVGKTVIKAENSDVKDDILYEIKSLFGVGIYEEKDEKAKDNDIVEEVERKDTKTKTDSKKADITIVLGKDY